MKNIWKNAILFLSLIGLMTFVSSCGSDSDPDPGATDIVYNMTGFDTNQTGVSLDPNGITATISGENVVIDGIPEGTTGLQPSTMRNGSQSLTAFYAGFTSGKFENDTAELYYKAPESNTRVKATAAEFTYTFSLKK